MTLTRGNRSSLRELSLSGLGGLGALPPIEPSAVKVFILSAMLDDGSEDDDDIDDVGDHDGGNGDEKVFWVSELVCPLIPAVSRFFVVITISLKIFRLMFGVGASVLCSLDNWRLVSLFKAV